MIAPARDALKDALSAQAAGLNALDGLYLGGSFARGIADDWSDLDYIAVTDAASVSALVADWIALVDRQGRLVYQAQRLFPGGALVNLITADWVRCDLLVEPPDRFATRTKDRVRPVVERKPLYATLAETAPLAPVRPEALTATVEEFLRVLGLGHLAAHRDDLFTAQWGVSLLRDQMRLFVLALEPAAAQSGALTLGRDLPPGRMARLKRLPTGGADMASVLRAQAGLTRRFLPEARQDCMQHGARWPGSFVAATAQVLRGVMEPAFCDWLAGQA